MVFVNSKMGDNGKMRHGGVFSPISSSEAIFLFNKLYEPSSFYGRLHLQEWQHSDDSVNTIPYNCVRLVGWLYLGLMLL